MPMPGSHVGQLRVDDHDVGPPSGAAISTPSRASPAAPTTDDLLADPDEPREAVADAHGPHR